MKLRTQFERVPRLAALWLCFVVGIPATAEAAVRVGQLRCEYTENPLGIDVPQPRLSWIIEASQQGFRQGGYRIVVATSPALVKGNIGDLWDSKMVSSDQSIQVAYEGKTLVSRQRCYWKVMVWDRRGQPVGSSDVDWWEMGLLGPEDWRAEWIAGSTDINALPAPMLRRAFSVRPGLKQARVYVCGLGYYELRLNGRKVGDHILDPGYTRYDKRVLYATYDVTAALKSGKNALGVVLGHGWFNVQTKAVWYFDKAPWRAAPRLRLQLRLEYENGQFEEILTDENWRSSTGPVIANSIYGGETYDARLEQPGWDLADYADARWQTARLVAAPKGRLVAQLMPPIKVSKTIAPVRLTEPKAGVFLFDLGQNFAGFARLNVAGPAGATVVMKYGERLNPDGTLDQSAIAQHLIKTNPPQPFQTDTYILRGQGKETWEPRFVYHGFQYVEVTGFPGKPTLQSLVGRVIHTAVPEAGHFACSNPLLNRIWQNTRWAYLSNLQGIPTDCPHREKNGWTGDAHLAAEQAFYNFFPPAFYTKWLNDLGDEQQPGGELPGIVPTSGWGYAWGNGPAWDSAFCLIPFYLYEYYGDTQVLRDHYEGMRRYVDYLTTKADHGIVSIGLGDWCPFDTETPVAITSTAYYYRDAQIVAQAAGLLGRPVDAQKYQTLAAEIRKAFNQRFYDPQTSQYANGSQTALSCALYQGLVEPDLQAAVVSNLVANVERRQGHLDCGILGTKYLLNALLDNGRADVAYRVAAQHTLPSWGQWVEQGATTLWENWRGAESRNHIMFGDVSAWFYKALAGINGDPKAPGFKRFIIKPQVVGDLEWVAADFASPHGRISSEWKKIGRGLRINVAVPANTTALVFVPASSPDSVDVNGGASAGSPGIESVRQQAGAAVFQVGSGQYQFNVRAVR